MLRQITLYGIGKIDLLEERTKKIVEFERERADFLSDAKMAKKVTEDLKKEHDDLWNRLAEADRKQKVGKGSLTEANKELSLATQAQTDLTIEVASLKLQVKTEKDKGDKNTRIAFNIYNKLFTQVKVVEAEKKFQDPSAN